MLNCKNCSIEFSRKDSRCYNKVLGENCFFCCNNCQKEYLKKSRLKMIVGNSLIILDKSSCWNFLSLGQDGYGKINIDNKTRRVPRVIISILRGEDLEDMSWVACHHCDNPACIRPSHLYAGTILENERDKNKRGRRPRGFGSVNCATKPIREEVNSKYLEGNLSMKEVGKLFGISACTVHRIVHGFAGMGRN